MEYRLLGRTGMRVSVPALGGIFREASAEETARVLDRALELGVNYFDTSPGYDGSTSEERMGEALSSRRQDVYLATKSDALDRAGAMRELETSLRRLRTDHVDVLQLHNLSSEAALSEALASGGAIEALLQAKEEGKARFIGLTGHRSDLLCKGIATGLFDVVLFVLNQEQPYALFDLVPLAHQLGVGTVVMKPLGRGWLAGRLRQTLRYVASRDVDTLVPGVSSVAELEEVTTAFDRPISPQEARELAALAPDPATVCRLSCSGCRPCAAGLDIPTALLAARCVARDGVPAKKGEEWSAMRKAAAACEDSEACRHAALCELRCPYHLSIRSAIRELARSPLN